MKEHMASGDPVQAGEVPLCVPEIRGNEWNYIRECLDTNWVSSAGSFVDRFESMLAEYVNAKYAVATINGTAALHIALLVAGVEPDDEVLVSTMTFIAPANAIRYAGAWPVFVDAEPQYWQMNPQNVVDFVEQDCSWVAGELRNKTTGRRVKAIVPVHIQGHPVDLDPIQAVAEKYNLSVIEDATESLGAKYKGQMVGHLGDIACFSFNGNKLITTGGGGMIVTDNEAWAQRARHLTTQAKDDPIEYIHDEIGYNYRLTNIQAAMGCAQMEQLTGYVKAKRALASRYQNWFKKFEVPFILEPSDARSNYWLNAVLLADIEERDSFLKYTNDHGVMTRPMWTPMHTLPMYQNCARGDLSISESIESRLVNIPSSVI